MPDQFQANIGLGFEFDRDRFIADTKAMLQKAGVEWKNFGKTIEEAEKESGTTRVSIHKQANQQIVANIGSANAVILATTKRRHDEEKKLESTKDKDLLRGLEDLQKRKAVLDASYRKAKLDGDSKATLKGIEIQQKEAQETLRIWTDAAKKRDIVLSKGGGAHLGLLGVGRELTGISGEVTRTLGFAGLGLGAAELLRIGKAANAIDNQLRGAFRTAAAGKLTISQLNQEVKNATNLAEEWSPKLLITSERLKEISRDAAISGGFLGERNKQLTIAAAAIEKITGGEVSSERFIKGVSRGFLGEEGKDAIGGLNRTMPLLASQLAGATTAEDRFAIAIKFSNEAVQQQIAYSESAEGRLEAETIKRQDSIERLGKLTVSWAGSILNWASDADVALDRLFGTVTKDEHPKIVADLRKEIDLLKESIKGRATGTEQATEDLIRAKEKEIESYNKEDEAAKKAEKGIGQITGAIKAEGDAASIAAAENKAYLDSFDTKRLKVTELENEAVQLKEAILSGAIQPGYRAFAEFQIKQYQGEIGVLGKTLKTHNDLLTEVAKFDPSDPANNVAKTGGKGKTQEEINKERFESRRKILEDQLQFSLNVAKEDSETTQEYETRKYNITKFYLDLEKQDAIALGQLYADIDKRIIASKEDMLKAVNDAEKESFKIRSKGLKELLLPDIADEEGNVGLKGEIKKLSEEAQKYADVFKNAVHGSMTTPIEEFIQKTFRAKNIFTQFLSSLASGVSGVLAGKLATSLTDSLFSTEATGLPKHATGGRISGKGTDTSDSILARVSNDEYILRGKAARSLGYDRLDYMNATGSLPSFAGGGSPSDRDYYVDSTVYTPNGSFIVRTYPNAGNAKRYYRNDPYNHFPEVSEAEFQAAQKSNTVNTAQQMAVDSPSYGGGASQAVAKFSSIAAQTAVAPATFLYNRYFGVAKAGAKVLDNQLGSHVNQGLSVPDNFLKLITGADLTGTSSFTDAVGVTGGLSAAYSAAKHLPHLYGQATQQLTKITAALPKLAAEVNATVDHIKEAVHLGTGGEEHGEADEAVLGGIGLSDKSVKTAKDNSKEIIKIANDTVAASNSKNKNAGLKTGISGILNLIAPGSGSAFNIFSSFLGFADGGMAWDKRDTIPAFYRPGELVVPPEKRMSYEETMRSIARSGGSQYDFGRLERKFDENITATKNLDFRITANEIASANDFGRGNRNRKKFR